MRVHHSLSNYYYRPLQREPDADTSGGTPFLLPEEEEQSGQQPAARTAASTPTAASSSISAFFLNQLGQSAAAQPTAAEETGETEDTEDGKPEASAADDTSSDPVTAEFEKWAHMTPAERIRTQYLKDHQLTEDSLRKLPPDQQKQVDDEITNQVRQQLGTDGTATAAKPEDGTSASQDIAALIGMG